MKGRPEAGAALDRGRRDLAGRSEIVPPRRRSGRVTRADPALVLVTRPMAVERPPLGLGLRALAALSGRGLLGCAGPIAWEREVTRG